jgi:hypothetical protein
MVDNLLCVFESETGSKNRSFFSKPGLLFSEFCPFFSKF